MQCRDYYKDIQCMHAKKFLIRAEGLLGSRGKDLNLFMPHNDSFHNKKRIIVRITV